MAFAAIILSTGAAAFVVVQQQADRRPHTGGLNRAHHRLMRCSM